MRIERRDLRVPALPIVALLLAALLLAALVQALPPTWDAQLQRAPPELRGQLQQRAATWAGWTPAQQQRFRERLAAWEALPHDARATQREEYAAWQALDSLDRQQAQTARARHAALPPEDRQALHNRFTELDTSLRHGWLLGPRLGVDYGALRPLLLQVPAGQRLPLLEALGAMSPAARADLAVLAQRTPPQERDALRRELLSTSAANRQAWLRSRLAQ